MYVNTHEYIVFPGLWEDLVGLRHAYYIYGIGGEEEEEEEL